MNFHQGAEERDMRTLQSVFGGALLVVLLTALSGGLASHADELEKMKQPQEARIYPGAREPGVEETRVRDTMIQGEILKAYFEDDAIETDRVDVSVEEGVVHLSGVVPDRSALERAERIAGSAKNVVSVVNELKVAEDDGGE
jgi:osmotically-inducible protein OsmY